MLAGVLTYFAINVVSTRVQQESFQVTDQHVWVNPSANPGDSDYCVAALMVLNNGGRDVVINKIEVRGQDCSWQDAAQFVVYNVTNNPITTDLGYVGNFTTSPTTGDNKLSIGGNNYLFTVPTNGLVSTLRLHNANLHYEP